MMKVCRANRQQIEDDFVGLILNYNNYLDIMQIKPFYLLDKDNRVILEWAQKCYEEKKVVDSNLDEEGFRKINLDKYIDLLNDTLLLQHNLVNQFNLGEESILKFYKEDVIESLNNKLKSGQIDYDKFMFLMKEIDAIQLQNNSITLTKKEILDNINQNTSRIELNHYDKFNNFLKLVRGDFLIIGATTGIGKSSFMLNLMNDFMGGFQCIYFNMEMSKSTIYQRIISIDTGIPMSMLDKPSEHQKQLIDKALDRIENNKIIIEHKANDIKQIKSVVAKRKNKDKHTIIFIDHVGLCRCDDKKSLYEQTTEVAKQLRQICLEYDCTVISACQLNRSAYSSDEISLSMLKDSGELEQSASKVVLLYKEKNTNKDADVINMNVEIAKNRDGICGIVEMKYDKTKQIFKEKGNY